MFSRFRSRNSAIMFDVGTAGVRAFQLTARGVRLSTRDSLGLDLPPQPRQTDGQLSPPDYSRMARMVGQGDFSGSDVGLVLSPPDVRFCALRLPQKALAQPERRVREALSWEVARETRAEAHQLEVHYWQLPPGNQQRLNVMAVSLPIERALCWHQLLARDGLHLQRIDVSPCALAHLACRMWSPAENELWGILDLGFSHSNLTVVLGRVPVYVRSLSTSSDLWTRRLAEAFEVGHTGAEEIKRAHGIRPVDRGIRPPQPNQSLLHAQDIPSVVFGLLREPLEDLVHEVYTCFSYVMQNFSDSNASRLLLAGGGAKLRGLTPYLELQLGLSVTPLASSSEAGSTQWEHPLPNTTVQPEAAAALGSAILALEAA